METRATAVVRLKFNSEKQLSTVLRSLVPEANASVTRRANAKIERDGLFLLLTFQAEDAVALRSTLNAFLRWINSTTRVINVVEQA